MRVIINFIWLSFFLLVGGQHLYAETQANTICDSSSYNFVKKEQVKVKTADLGNVLIEEADVDLDEEFHSGDDLNKGSSNKITAVKNSLLDSWYLSFANTLIYKDYSKQIEIFALNCGDSNPIYLIIGVLRI
jgi:hypothetical protein